MIGCNNSVTSCFFFFAHSHAQVIFRIYFTFVPPLFIGPQTDLIYCLSSFLTIYIAYFIWALAITHQFLLSWIFTRSVSYIILSQTNNLLPSSSVLKYLTKKWSCACQGFKGYLAVLLYPFQLNYHIFFDCAVYY